MTFIEECRLFMGTNGNRLVLCDVEENSGATPNLRDKERHYKKKLCLVAIGNTIKGNKKRV